MGGPTLKPRLTTGPQSPSGSNDRPQGKTAIRKQRNLIKNTNRLNRKMSYKNWNMKRSLSQQRPVWLAWASYRRKSLRTDYSALALFGSMRASAPFQTGLKASWQRRRLIRAPNDAHQPATRKPTWAPTFMLTRIGYSRLYRSPKTNNLSSQSVWKEKLTVSWHRKRRRLTSLLPWRLSKIWSSSSSKLDIGALHAGTWETGKFESTKPSASHHKCSKMSF